MPRKPRFFLDEVPVHIVQRGHCREPVFFEASDYATYIYHLSEACKRYRIRVHSYCLMTNHVHLLLTPHFAEDVSRAMQYVGRQYVPYINYKYGKSGTLWEGRFKSSLVCDQDYLINVMRYIEMNPVRASMVESPSEYYWSSFKHNIGQLNIQLVKEHEVFARLGDTLRNAQLWYRESFSRSLSEDAVKKITAAWLTGTPLGNERFRAKVEQTLNQRVGLARKGRPRKSD